MSRYNNRSTCPQELLLFFHNLPWTHPIALRNGSTAPLMEYRPLPAAAAAHIIVLSEFTVAIRNDTISNS